MKTRLVLVVSFSVGASIAACTRATTGTEDAAPTRLVDAVSEHTC
jgi:hypothetical protein